MPRLQVPALLFAFLASLSAAAGPQPFLCPRVAAQVRDIEAAQDPAARRKLVDALMAHATPAPVLEPGSRPDLGCATFLYRGSAARVALAGDLNGWEQDSDFLAGVAGTDLFVASRELPLDARLDYKFLADGKWTLDPLNPRTMAGGYGPNSELEMQGYRPPAEVERRDGVPRGRLEPLKVTPRSFRPRRVQVYLPAGYERGNQRYPTLYLHDGQDTLDFAKIDVILDNLIEGRVIPPVIAVLVPPVKREEEYAANAAYDDFLVRELVPQIDRRYRTLAAAEHRVVGGISMGGVAALSVMLRHRDVFGAAIGQSTASGQDDLVPLLGAAAAAAKPPARIWLDVGRFEERFHGLNMVALNRSLRDAFKAAGHEVRYLEVDEGHSWGSWRARMRDALPFVLGAGPARP